MTKFLKHPINQPTNYPIKRKGFTLIEMLVVMSIVALLSVLILAQYRYAQKQYALQQAAEKLASDIRRAQNMAISGAGITQNIYGYGIYLKKDDSTYTLYADTEPTRTTKNGNCFYDRTGPSKDDKEYDVTLSSGINIEKVEPAYPVSTGPYKDSLHICFVPPDPSTYINNDQLVSPPTSIIQTATTTLTFSGTNLKKYIVVTNVGSIEIK